MWKAAVVCFFMFLAASGVAATVPASLRPPADQKLLFQFHGSGDRIYLCSASGGQYAWTLKAPDAQLRDDEGQVVGHHFAGPTWEGKDGSRVVAKAVSNVASPNPDSVAWLLLSATGHEGSGSMSKVGSIQRLDTKGGKAPKTGCDSEHAGTEVRVPYTAEYYFYGKRM